MSKYHIPKPCPEKWSDMSPTEDGAMCHVCATEVLDFTNKSPEEIRDIMKEYSGKKVCAKMAPEEGYKVPTEILSRNGMDGFRLRFVYALVMVFGLTLFGCDRDDDGWEGPVGMVSFEGDEYVVGDVEPEDVGMVEKTPIDSPEIAIPDTNTEFIKIGEVAPDTNTKHIKIGKVAIDPDEHNFVKGKIEIIEEDDDNQ